MPRESTGAVLFSAAPIPANVAATSRDIDTGNTQGETPCF